MGPKDKGKNPNKTAPDDGLELDSSSKTETVKVTVRQTQPRDYSEGVDGMFAKPKQRPSEMTEKSPQTQRIAEEETVVLEVARPKGDSGKDSFLVEGARITSVAPPQLADLLALLANSPASHRSKNPKKK